MPCRAPSIYAPVAAQSNAAGRRMSKANWARQLQSAPQNWKLSVNFWGKTSTASYETERNRRLSGTIPSNRFLSDLPNDRLARKVTR
jgi:hypothetical protein